MSLELGKNPIKFKGLKKLKTRQKILIGFSVPLALMALVASFVYLSIEKLEATSQWVLHTQEVISRANLLGKLVVDMETGERGFLISGKTSFLEPFNKATQDWNNEINGLKTLVSDNPPQVKQAEKIDELVELWLDKAAKPEIAMRLEVNQSRASLNEVTAIIESETGKNIMDSLRKELGAFIQVEEDLMKIRIEESTRASNRTIMITVFGTLFAIFLAIAVAILVSNAIVKNLIILLEAAKKVTKGQYSDLITIKSNDEIGDLSIQFNTMTKALTSAREKMEAATKAKGDFLANMSHEIRTPLNGVLGMVSLLDSTSLTPEQEKMLKTIRVSGENLMVVVNDILDISKLDADKLMIDKKPFSLKKCIEESIYLMSPKAAEKSIIITQHVEENLSESFIGDDVRIRQILVNFLSNAIKFTDRNGSIQIRVRLKEKKGDVHKLSFSVKDSGMGISEEDQAKLFKSFSQVDESITRKHGGTGLGLAICAKLTQLMHGTIGVKSEEGVGTKFFFTIALNSCKIKQFEQKQVVSSCKFNADMAKEYPLEILLVEDNQVNQELGIGFFTKMGYKIDAAWNGSEAITCLENRRYDLVFMDMQMPVLDGVSATKIIVEKWGEKRPRIIAMTANVLPEDRQKCIDAGMDGFVTKPFTRKILVETIIDSHGKIHAKPEVELNKVS